MPLTKPKDNRSKIIYEISKEEELEKEFKNDLIKKRNIMHYFIDFAILIQVTVMATLFGLIFLGQTSSFNILSIFASVGFLVYFLFLKQKC